MIRRRSLLAAAGGTFLGSALATGTAHADATIAVNPSTTYGTWEGWGTSLAWWANVFGARDDFAELVLGVPGDAERGGVAVHARPVVLGVVLEVVGVAGLGHGHFSLL